MLNKFHMNFKQQKNSQTMQEGPLHCFEVLKCSFHCPVNANKHEVNEACFFVVPDMYHFPQNSVVLCKSSQWQIDKIITVENEYS